MTDRTPPLPPTPRLTFRCWGPEDLALARALWGDPEVTRLIGGPFSEGMIAERLTVEIDRWDRFHVQYWPLFDRFTGELVGAAGLRPHPEGPRTFELGFHLRPGFWGRGLASEAAAAVVAHGFASLGAEALVAGHHPENVASRRVLLRLGFEPMGEEFYAPTGRFHPSYRLRRPASDRAVVGSLRPVPGVPGLPRETGNEP
jgi:ribosomal-protein-alanine N-acetyltransferase